MRGMGVYYVVVGILMYGLNSLLSSSVQPNVASAAMVMVLWVFLLIDAKLVPLKISILRNVLPAFSWIDVLAFFVLCTAMSYVALNQGNMADKAALLQTWLGAALAADIYAMVRWIGWRRPRDKVK